MEPRPEGFGDLVWYADLGTCSEAIMQPRVHIQGTPSFSIVFTCKAVRAQAWLGCIMAPTASTNVHKSFSCTCACIQTDHIVASRNTPLGTRARSTRTEHVRDCLMPVQSSNRSSREFMVRTHFLMDAPLADIGIAHEPVAHNKVY